MRKDGAVLRCPKCGREEAGQAGAAAPAREAPAAPGGINVFEENEGDEMLPTIDIECEKCGNGQAAWWMLQTRSADEPTTQFYRCTKCGYTWRNYA